MAEEQVSSPEGIMEYRAKAQQDSINAIRAAEERYAKAKQSAAAARETAGGTLQDVKGRTTEVARRAKSVAVEKGRQAADYASEKGKQGHDAAGDALARAKDAAASAGRSAADYTAQRAEQAKDYVLHKVSEAKDATVSTTQSTAGSAGQKASDAKEGLKGWIGGGQKKAEKENESHKIVDTFTIMKEEHEPVELGEVQRGGILEAVGDTVIGIVHSAKEMVVGPDPNNKD